MYLVVALVYLAICSTASQAVPCCASARCAPCGHDRETVHAPPRDAPRNRLSRRPAPIGRMLAIVELVAVTGTISVAQVVETLGIPRPTAHRMVAMLEAVGYLQKLPGRTGYGPAPKLVSLASDIMASTVVYSALNTTPRTRRAHRRDVQPGDAVGRRRRVHRQRVRRLAADRSSSRPGRRRRSTARRAADHLLANLSDERLETFLASGPWQPVTPQTLTRPAQAARGAEGISVSRATPSTIPSSSSAWSGRGPPSATPRTGSSRP